MDAARRSHLIRVVTENWREELVISRLYRALAQLEEAADHRALLTLMAVSEEEHADLWARRLEDLGQEVDPQQANHPFLEQLRRLQGKEIHQVIREIEREERARVADYQAQIRSLDDPESTAILEKVVPDEEAHARRLREMAWEAEALLRGGAGRWRPGRILQHLPGETVPALASGLGLLAGVLLGGKPGTLILLGALLAGSFPALREAAEALRRGKLDVELLMLAAAYGAAWIGRPAEGALLLFLFALSSALEAYAMGRTRDAVRRLVGMRPRTARSEDGTPAPVERVRPGDRFVVHPGEIFPLDGVVRSGRSSVDASALTGEAEPVAVEPGVSVAAGTLNLDGVLTVEATTTVEDSTLERVIRLVDQAQSESALASHERLAERMGRYYTPVVLVACGVFYLWLRLQGLAFVEASYRALALLIAASPCALVLSSPVAVLSALAAAGRQGILVRSGSVLEALARVDTVVLDKTGTLTTGIPTVHALWWAGGGEEEALRYVAAAEAPSPHPLARAVVAEARRRGLEVPEAGEHRSIPGRGVEAVVEGVPVRVGQLGWIGSEELERRAVEVAEAGCSIIAFEVGGRPGLVALQETARHAAGEALDELRRLGIGRLVMFTGDHGPSARTLARRFSLSEVKAELHPEEKASEIRALVASGRVVAMVGDGVNDAPALARAHVGVTLGGIASDVALEGADVVVMEDRLSALPQAVALARRARAVAVQNLALSLASVALLTAAVLMSGIPLPLAVLAHEGTTLLVVLNGLRLLRSGLYSFPSTMGTK